jgi:hypothetical protein
MANTYLTRSKSSPTSDKKGTISFWIKRSNLTDQQATFVSGGGSIDSNIFFENDGTLQVYDYQSGAYQFRYVTNRVFRDPSAWYHIVVRIDTTDGTAGDRVKIYVNGVQETSFSTSTNPSQNLTPLFFTNAYAFWIGAYRGSSGYTDGLYTHFHYTDGYAYDASTFGESDSVSGIWKPKTAPSVTYGTNGFFLKFENSGAMGTDSSGNGNNFTVSGTLTQNVDTPSNNFPTFNALAPSAAALNFGNGNLYNGDQSPNNWQSLPSTIGCSSGKWYWELKDESDWGSTSDSTRRYGIVDLSANLDQSIGSSNSVRFSDATSAYAYMNESGVRHNGGTISGSASTHPTFAEGDFIMVAMDLDNNKLYFGKNGTWNDSGNPASGASGTGSVATLASGVWSPYVETRYGSDNVSINFGQGYFRTAVAGTNADANGHGKFKYSVPSGYYSINTKNIKEFG